MNRILAEHLIKTSVHGKNSDSDYSKKPTIIVIQNYIKQNGCLFRRLLFHFFKKKWSTNGIFLLKNVELFA